MGDQLDNYDIIQPCADAMVQSLRAYGYDLAMAMADLIDNSVTAHAQNIWIDHYWDGGKTTITLTDDGNGMREDELREAMRLGSNNSLAIREARDLGRFGLGLKTASFSQAKKLTVASKYDGQLCTRQWDIDHVSATNSWQLLRSGSTVFAERGLTRLHSITSGTVVFWESLDRLIPSDTHPRDSKAQILFYERISMVSAHLSMVFHRYLKPDSAQRAIHIFIQGREIKAWDPFLVNEPATRLLSHESLILFGDTLTVRAYILPRLLKVKPDVYERAAGPKGWIAHQGFYVYRNRRLLVAGDWLGLKNLQKEPDYRLARILVDIPNTMDTHWEIDVKKSRAYPPPAIRESLTAMANATRSESLKVCRHRGARLQNPVTRKLVVLWEPVYKNNLLRYRLNREHPVVKNALEARGDAVEQLIHLIEHTIPIHGIDLVGGDSNKQLTDAAEADSEAIYSAMCGLYSRLVRHGISIEEAQRMLSTLDPFHRYPTLLKRLEEINVDSTG